MGQPFYAAAFGAILLAAANVVAGVAPIISPIPDQVANEDEPILHVPFTVWDDDTPLDRIRFVTWYSFNGANSSRDNMVIGGTGSNRWFSIYPIPDSSGIAQARIMALDGTGLSATAQFQVQVIPANDPPRLPEIPDQTVLKGQSLLSVPLTVTWETSTTTATSMCSPQPR